jgi:transcriptional regulator with XRE-family HTH domain
MDIQASGSLYNRLHLPNHIGVQLQQRPIRAGLHVVDRAARDLAHVGLGDVDAHTGEPVSDLLLREPGSAERCDDLVGFHVPIPFGIFCHAGRNMQDGLNRGMREALDTIGQRLKSARLAREWTQGQLAQQSGVKQSTISKLEAGKMHRGTQLLQLADALGVHLRWLDSGEGPRELTTLRERPGVYHQDADLERSLIQAMRDMPHEDREAIVADATRRADSFQAKLHAYLAEQAKAAPAGDPPGQVAKPDAHPPKVAVLRSGTATSERRVDHWNPATHAPKGAKPSTHIKPKKRGA